MTFKGPFQPKAFYDSKRAVTPVICERPNPPVPLVSLQRIPTALGPPPVSSQEELGTSPLRAVSISTDRAGRHAGTFRSFQG